MAATVSSSKWTLENAYEYATSHAVAPTSPGGEPLYNCPFEGCDKQFSKRFNLKAHLRKHTGDKPFKCAHPNCGRRFMWKSSLTSHEMGHKRRVQESEKRMKAVAAAAAAAAAAGVNVGPGEYYHQHTPGTYRMQPTSQAYGGHHVIYTGQASQPQVSVSMYQGSDAQAIDRHQYLNPVGSLQGGQVNHQHQLLRHQHQQEQQQQQQRQHEQLLQQQEIQRRKEAEQRMQEQQHRQRVEEQQRQIQLQHQQLQSQQQDHRQQPQQQSQERSRQPQHQLQHQQRRQSSQQANVQPIPPPQASVFGPPHSGGVRAAMSEGRSTHSSPTQVRDPAHSYGEPNDMKSSSSFPRLSSLQGAGYNSTSPNSFGLPPPSAISPNPSISPGNRLASRYMLQSSPPPTSAAFGSDILPPPVNADIASSPSPPVKRSVHEVPPPILPDVETAKRRPPIHRQTKRPQSGVPLSSGKATMLPPLPKTAPAAPPSQIDLRGCNLMEDDTENAPGIVQSGTGDSPLPFAPPISMGGFSPMPISPLQSGVQSSPTMPYSPFGTSGTTSSRPGQPTAW